MTEFNTKGENNVTLRSMARCGGAALFAIVGMAAAFRSGLFFDEYFYPFQIALFLLAAAFIAYRLLSRRTPDIPGWAWAPFAIGLLYAIPLMLGAASVKGTIDQMLRWCAYGSFLMLFAAMARKRDNMMPYHYAFQAIGVFVGLGALAGFFGLFRFPELLMVTQDEQLSAVGVRLAGFFQYANTFGAVMGAFALYQLIAAVRARTQGAFLLASLPAMPQLVSLLLTESRGAWLALAAGLVAGLVYAGRGRMLAFAVYAAVHGGFAAAAYRLMLEYAVRQDQPAFACIAFVALWAAALLLGTVLWRMHNRTHTAGRNFTIVVSWIAITASFAACLAFVFGPAHGRLTGNFATVGARGQFYADALRIFRDSPVYGFGGGSWGALFRQYRSEPYVGSEVHSGYLEILLDLGALGFVPFIALIAICLWRIWQTNRAFLPPLLVLFGHSAVDFDLSFGFVGLMICYLIVMGLRSNEAAGKGVLRRSEAWYALRYAVPVVLMLCICIAGAYSVRFAAAAWSAHAGLPLETALRWNPYWSEPRIVLAQQLPADQAVTVLRRGLQYDPYDRKLHWELGSAYVREQDGDAAAYYLGRALVYDRFDADKQVQALYMLERLAFRQAAEGKAQQALRTAQGGLDLYRNYEEAYRQYANSAPHANGRKFDLRPEARRSAANLRQITDMTHE